MALPRDWNAQFGLASRLRILLSTLLRIVRAVLWISQRLIPIARWSENILRLIRAPALHDIFRSSIRELINVPAKLMSRLHSLARA